MKLVYVEWLDHCSFTESDWKDAEEFDDLEPPLVKTIGWIIREDEKVLIVVSSKYNSDEFNDKYSGEMCIIKGCIQKMKELKV
jgi:hypothetical protein